MKIPFIKVDGRSSEEKQLQKVIQKEAWTISKKAMMRTLKSSDVDKLEKLYKKYFEKYPDAERQLNSEIRIRKLRQII